MWFDGSSTVSAESLQSYVGVLQTGKIHPDRITDDIARFNKMKPKSKQLGVKQAVVVEEPVWNLPPGYADLDITERCFQRLLDTNPVDIDQREQRVCDEIRRFQRMGLVDLLRIVAYIVDTFEQQGVIWGVGRGSSVSSYVLYLLGIHDVDSFAYDLPITDFLKET